MAPVDPHVLDSTEIPGTNNSAITLPLVDVPPRSGPGEERGVQVGDIGYFEGLITLLDGKAS